MFSDHKKEREILNIDDVASIRIANGFHYSVSPKFIFYYTLQEGDKLKNGDLIKTGEKGEVKIQFLKSNSYLSPEPDSQITILRDKHNGLDLVEGSSTVFVSENESVFIVDQNRKVNLNPGLHYITRDSTDRLQINPSNIISYDCECQINWKYPIGNTIYLVNPDENIPLRIQWDHDRLVQTDSDFEIYFEWGLSRKKIANKVKLNIKDGFHDVRLPAGKYFWRWSIYSHSENRYKYIAPTSIMIIKNKFPPIVLSPTGQALISDQMKISLKWVKHSRFSQYKIEVYNANNLNKSILNELVTDKDELIFKPQTYSSYLWRISGLDKETNTWVTSKMHYFKFVQETTENNKIEIEKIVNPYLYYVDKPELLLRWKSHRSFKDDHITYMIKFTKIENDFSGLFPLATKLTEYKLPIKAEGNYKLMIDAVNKLGVTVATSPVVTLEVKKAPKLLAPLILAQDLFIKGNNQGDILLKWSDVAGAVSYQLEIIGKNNDIQKHLVTKNKLLLKKMSPGEYEYRVQGVDVSGHLGDFSMTGIIDIPAISSVKGIKIKKVEIQ